MKFCKILENEDEQFLIIKDFNEEDDSLYVGISFLIEGFGKVEMKLGANDEKHQQEIFDKTTFEMAQKQKDSILKQIGLSNQSEAEND
jgi:hypothetical protein